MATLYKLFQERRKAKALARGANKLADFPGSGQGTPFVSTSTLPSEDQASVTDQTQLARPCLLEEPATADGPIPTAPSPYEDRTSVSEPARPTRPSYPEEAPAVGFTMTVTLPAEDQ
ncbi:hypothetical protein V5O48_015214, partial [Marasmius crinis-equi]